MTSKASGGRLVRTERKALAGVKLPPNEADDTPL